MPDLLERMYCAQQINIPPNLPFILKQYAKAAIRTQPYDLLFWSAAYFRAKANNTLPPVKERLEYPSIGSPSRLSPGFLKVLHKQLGENEYVAVEVLYERWLGVCLVKESLDAMLKVGNLHDKVPWLKFVAIAAGHLCQSLTKTMVLVCEVLTEEPEGGSAMIPVEVFDSLYQFLARLDCGPLPPNVETIEFSGQTYSVATTVGSQMSTDDDDKQETFCKVEGISERDSSAGLMVWPDLKPIEKPDQIQSPKYLEDDGALSDMGVEVLDDAQGPVTEVITLYPAHSQIQSSLSVPYTPSSKEADTGIDGTILSHTSFKETGVWIKIEKRPDDIILGEKHPEVADYSVLSKVTFEADDPKVAVDDIKGQSDASENLNEKEILEFKKSDDEDKENAASEEQERYLEDPKEKASSGGIHKDDSQSNNESLTQSEKRILFEDSVAHPSETVTVTHFFKDKNTQERVSRSTVEIRKGICGEKSGQHLQRDSSENTVKEAMTVFKLEAQEESSEFIDLEKQAVESNKDKSSSEKFSCEGESHSSINLSVELLQQEIPGIGPVVPEAEILAVLEYMQYWAAKQHGMVMPRNINHILCPPLDLPSAIRQTVDDHSQY